MENPAGLSDIQQDGLYRPGSPDRRAIDTRERVRAGRAPPPREEIELMSNHPRSRILATCAAALLTVAAPGSVRAQLGGIEGIFKQVDDVNLSVGCWSVSSPAIAKADDCPSGMRDYGVEVSFRLADLIIGPKKVTEWWEPQQRETSGTGGSADTTVTSVPRRREEPLGWYALLELGLGYSQFSGFRSNVTNLDLRGTVRELPSVTLYATAKHARHDWAGAYVGVRSGLIQLNDLQAFTGAEGDTAVSYAGSGQVFQMGLVGGVSAQIRRMTFFAEAASMNRDFESVRWSSAASRVPPQLPRRLNFSGRSVAVGVQVKISK
jgi:hypothetical protein